MFGSVLGFDAIFPDRKSVLVIVLSNSVSNAKEPQGVASFIGYFPLNIEVIFVFIG